MAKPCHSHFIKTTLHMSGDPLKFCTIKGLSCFSKPAVGMSGTSCGSTNWVKEQSIKVLAIKCVYQGAYIV